MMPSFSGLALTAALLTSYVAAAPAEDIAGRSTFRVHQVPNSKWNDFKASGPAAMAKTYAKYSKHGAVMPEDVKSAVAAAAQSGSVTASPEDGYDSAYLCPVSIGTPAKTLTLDFDTGSSDLWVFSSEQPTSQSAGHTVYTPTASSTEKKLSGSTWSISYGDGSGASGDVYVDKVVVGPVTATSQAVEAATSVSSTFMSDTDTDGLLGLAFSSINTVKPTKQTTFFDTVKSSLASPLFAADLKHQAAGTYDFGYIDSSKYTGSISYTNVKTSNGFWEITGSGYAVGTSAFVSSSIDAIVDTGTTLLYLPTAAVTAYYKQVSGAAYNTAAGGYIFPCSAKLPNFTFGVGSYRGVIPGSYMNYSPYGSSCFGGIQRNTGIGFSIYGDILLKAQYVVFSGASTPQVGFAAKTL